MSQRIKKVGSNIESDAQSVILSGNLSDITASVDFLDFEDDQDFVNDFTEESKSEAKANVDGPLCTLEDYQKVNQVFDNLYGISLLDVITKLLLNGSLDAQDFAIQSLVYKTQCLVRGSSGVR